MTKGSENSNASSKVKVAVRVRPFNKREIDLNTKCVVDMKDDQTFLSPITSGEKQSERKQTKTFAFDHCFWSMDPNEKKFADQEQVFQCLGIELLENAFSGYNACIFAYGQTGSGKSYTMMGGHDQPGLIPRLCTALFERIEAQGRQSFKVEVSYMEIYNEKVRDLLDPNGGKQHLKVREHKVLGPYVDGLQQLLTSSAHDVQELMSEGSKSRTVAATKMNAESSRSHAVFTLIVTHTMTDVQSGMSGERVSKLSLVDLAGSERSSKTGASGARLKEGSNINKSLTTLGLVISALADQAAGKAKNKFVPYRDSTLTWILKDNLGGNSRTTMVATLSPSADNYEETLSTLRYADRAKRIVNKAVVNEDPNARIIRELREEVEKLLMQLKQSESMSAPDLREKLDESQKLMEEMSQSWEEKLRKTEMVHKKRQETFEKMGISLESSGIKLEKTKCFLVNLNADPSLNELLVYYLKEVSRVGHCEDCDIQLSGLGIQDKHAEMRVEETDSRTNVTIIPLDGARTCVNGRVITCSTPLRHGDRILWGNNHFFRINVPKILKKREVKLDFQNDLEKEPNKSLDLSLHDLPISYEDAQHEVLLNQADTPIQDTIMNLEHEFQLLQNGNTEAHADGLPNSSFNLQDEERKKYENEIDSLRRQLTTLTSPSSAASLDRSGIDPVNLSFASPSIPPAYQKYRNMKDERERSLRTSISCLREKLCRAQLLAGEANQLALELHKQTEFTVTMRIPAHNLTPNRKNGVLLCEPAVQVVRQGKECQIWSVEKLSNRLVDMRDLYDSHKQEREEARFVDPLQKHANDRFASNQIELDPFNDHENKQSLIGVANVFLSCLLQDAPLRYPLPIIDQQGQVVGKLIVELQTLSGFIPDDMMLGGCDLPEEEESKDGRIGERDSCNSFDVRSNASLSSGVGSSLSTDPTAGELMSDPLKSNTDKTILRLSDSSLSSASTPIVPVIEVEKVPEKKTLPQLTCRLQIVEAQGLSASLSPYVECQFTLFNQETIVIPPQLTPDQVSPKRSTTLNIRFNYSRTFAFDITEEFVDHLTSNNSLGIEVWGHRNPYHQHHHVVPRSASQLNAGGRFVRKSRKNRSASLLKEKSRSLKERWEEVVKRIRLDVVIQELADNGEYAPIEIALKPEVSSVGVFQLKQGQSRRIEVRVSPVPNSGTLPLICESIAAMYAGSITGCSTDKNCNLDSYQEKDLLDLRSDWTESLDKRKNHLNKQINSLSNKGNKTDLEKEREGKLFDQWVMMTEERNALLAPTPDSGVPGAPVWSSPPPSCEVHVPILFLDLHSQSDEYGDLIREPAGLDSLLPQEDPGTFVQLPFVRSPLTDYRGHVTAIGSWDSSMHDSSLLNRITPSSGRVYVVVKVHVRLSHPVEMDVVLRKRICVSVYKQKGFAAALKRKIQGTLVKKINRDRIMKASSFQPLSSSGVVYEVISNVPLATSDGEDHEALAMIAASGANLNGSQTSSLDKLSEEDEDMLNDEDQDGSHFEKFVIQATRSVDNILALDRIRQEVAIRDALLKKNSFRSPNGGFEVMSIISKRNRTHATSVYSGFSPYRPAESKVPEVS